jgi:exosortase
MSQGANQGRSGVIAAACLVGMVLAAIVGLPSVFGLLHETWTQVYAAFAHGYLVLGLAIWLGVRNWRRKPPAALRPYWPAAVATIAIGCLIAFLDNLGLGATRLVFLPALLLSAAWWVLGRYAAKILLIPAALLHFALPPWAVLDRPLQWLTTTVVNFAVKLTSLPAYVEGNHFHLPAGTFEIALGCSGLNYLITAFALFSFQGAAYLQTWHDRVRVLLVASAVAVVANWVRVYLLIAIGYWTDMQHYLIRVEHHYFGWALFAVLMWPVLNWAVSFEAPTHGATYPAIPTPEISAAVSTAFMLAVIGIVGLRLLNPSPVETPRRLAYLPDKLVDWHAVDTLEVDWKPEFPGASVSMRGYVSGADQTMHVLRVAYLKQTAEARLDFAKNNIAGVNARLESEWPEDIKVGQEAFKAVVREIRIGDKLYALWTVKAIGGATFRNRLDGLLVELLPTKRDRTAVLVGVAIECKSDCTTAHAIARATTTNVFPILVATYSQP